MTGPTRSRGGRLRAGAIALSVAPLVTVACSPDPALRSEPTGSGTGATWLAPVPSTPRIADDSARLVDRLARNGPLKANLYEFGTPVVEADASTPRQAVRCTEPWGTCDLEAAPVPIPDDLQPAPGSDAAFVVIDRSSDSAYEFWRAERRPDGTWTTAWGSRIPLSGDGRRGETGAGTSLLAGLVRADEIRAGVIDHPVRVASQFTCRDVAVYPAVKTDGRDSGPDCLPMGTRLQLDPTLDLTAMPDLTPAERAVGTAMQRYGAYVLNSAGAPLIVGFEKPTRQPDPYPAAGLPYDYAALDGIPLDRLRVVAAS